MTQLRQTMIRAMELKNLSKNTQRAYLAAVSSFSAAEEKVAAVKSRYNSRKILSDFFKES